MTIELVAVGQTSVMIGVELQRLDNCEALNVEGLLDSGVTNMFINYNFAQRNNLPMEKLHELYLCLMWMGLEMKMDQSQNLFP